MLVRQTGDRWWAWFGAEVTSAADLTRTRDHAALTEAERYRKALEAERAWLAGCWSDDHRPLELRWLADGRGRLRLFVLGRAAGASSPDLDRRVEQARHAHESVPRHVAIERLDSPDEVARVLSPFGAEPADPAGAAQLRKRCVVGTPSQPDPEARYYFAVEPYGVRPERWPALVAALATSPTPLMVSVGLEPTTAPPGLAASLAAIASWYGERAERRVVRGTGLYTTAREVGPEAFAVDARRFYADAARRLAGRVFRMRISVLSPEALDEGILNLVAATVEPAEIDRPRPDDRSDVDASVRNVAALAFERWGGHPVWRWPAPPSPAQRAMTELVDVDEALAAARLPVAVTGNLPGFPVRAPEFDVAASHRVASYGVAGRTIRLATEVVAGRDGPAVEMAVDDLTAHALYAGMTGTGKSAAVMHLLEQLWVEHRVPFLVLDPAGAGGNGYRRLLDTPGFDDAVVLTAGAEDIAPLRLNPFAVPAGGTVDRHIDNLLGCLDAAFGLPAPARVLYGDALARAYAKATAEPTLADVEGEVARLAAGRDGADGPDAGLTLVRALARGPARSILDCRRSYPLDVLLSRPVVVELGHLGSGDAEGKSLVMALVLTALSEHLVRRGRRPGLGHVTVVEGAHRLLGGPAAGGPFASLLADARAHGEGLLLVDQDPARLGPAAVRHTSLKVMFRLPDAGDRAALGQAMSFDDDHTRQAGHLDDFMAFVHRRGMDRPAYVRTAGADPTAVLAAGTADDKAVRERFVAVIERSPALAAALAPYDACSGCRAVCRHRSASETLARRSITVEFIGAQLDQIPDGSDGPAATRWHHDVSAWLGGMLDDAGVPSGPDARACLFLHACRAVGPERGHLTPLVWRHRDEIVRTGR